jgi:hypothetical protein
MLSESSVRARAAAAVAKRVRKIVVGRYRAERGSRALDLGAFHCTPTQIVTAAAGMLDQLAVGENGC